MDDVEDIKITGIQADNPVSEAPVFEINNGKNIIISETWGWEKHDKFLSLDEESNGIIIMNNDLSNFSKIAEPISKEQVKLINNNVE
jgi:hypothetical protein